MAYNIVLADRVRTHLHSFPNLKIEEKKMFRGLAFLVHGKMCVNVSGENLMCRFDPELEHEVAEKIGFQPMIMKGRQLRGYCYVSEEGYKSKRNFEYWVKLCLDFNDKARASKSRKASGQRSKKQKSE
jgi:TfoX/Sxy family transcriptional regulator of competence genes